MRIATTPSTSASHEAVTIYVAMELSKTRWLVAIHTPLDDKVSRHGVIGGDGDGLLDLIERRRERVARGLGCRVDVVSCYEAGHDGFWLHRLLRRHGIENHVMDPASLPVDRRARRPKTDRLDAATMLRALMAWYRGEPQVCRMVRVPSPEQEDRRRRSRERQRLTKERTQHVSRIKGLLMTQGVRTFEPGRTDWRTRLDELRTGDGRPLPPTLKGEILRECERLWQVIGMIRALDREAPASCDQQVTLLTRLRGVGSVSAAILAEEVFYRDFRNRREVAGYVGLTSSPYKSGSVARDQGLSRSGNPRARRAIVELAWLWLRYQPTSRLSRWFHERVGESRGRFRRIMLVALARKLLIALWRYVNTGVVPENAALSR